MVNQERQGTVETRVFYFSATGNCLSVAKKICAALENSVALPLTRRNGTDVRGGVLGVVSPIYMYDMPHSVIEFITSITRADYLFFVYAGGGETGGGMRKVRRLCKKQNLPLQALFNIAMPSNYTPYGYPDDQELLFQAANDRIKAIVETVANRKQHYDMNTTGFFRSAVYPGLLYKLGHSQIPRMDKAFSCEESCSGCGICEKLCPANNISMKNGRPQWNHKCEHCFACLNWCAHEAIQYRNATKGKRRYRHPDANVNDFVAHMGRVSHEEHEGGAGRQAPKNRSRSED